MDVEKFKKLIETAQEINWAIKLKTTFDTKMILDPSLGKLEIVEIGDGFFLRLKRSLLDIAEISSAHLYSTMHGDSNAE